MRRLAIAVAGSALLAGCGGDDDPSPSTQIPLASATATAEPATTPEPTPEAAATIPLKQWSKRVSRICERRAARARRYVLSLGDRDLPASEVAARVLEASPRLTRATLKQVDALPPPDGYQLDARELTDLIRRTFRPIRNAAQAIRDDDDAAGGRASAAILAYSLPAAEIATELNVTVCLPEESR